MKKLVAGFLIGFVIALPFGAGAVLQGLDLTSANTAIVGPLDSAKGGAGTITGALKGNGAGVVTQAALADLSDYATGTWTPAITAAGTAGTPAYSVQSGSYEKIGRQVTLRGAIGLSAWAGVPAGNVTITGLPFTSANVAGDGGRCYFSFWTVASSGGVITGEIAPNNSVITVYNSSSTASTNLTAANTGTTPSLDFSCNYHI